MIVACAFRDANRYHAKYQRNNKRSGLKNLRCFPRCPDSGHRALGFCGTPIVAEVQLTLRGGGGEQRTAAIPRHVVAWGEFGLAEYGGARYHVTQTVDSEEIANTLVRTADDVMTRPLFPSEVVVVGTGTNGAGERSSSYRFTFESGKKGYHYSWHGNKYTSEKEHCFYVYLAAGASPTTMQIVGVFRSPRFTMYCRRRHHTVPEEQKHQLALAPTVDESRIEHLKVNPDGSLDYVPPPPPPTPPPPPPLMNFSSGSAENGAKRRRKAPVGVKQTGAGAVKPRGRAASRGKSRGDHDDDDDEEEEEDGDHEDDEGEEEGYDSGYDDEDNEMAIEDEGGRTTTRSLGTSSSATRLTLLKAAPHRKRNNPTSTSSLSSLAAGEKLASEKRKKKKTTNGGDVDLKLMRVLAAIANLSKLKKRLLGPSTTTAAPSTGTGSGELRTMSRLAEPRPSSVTSSTQAPIAVAPPPGLDDDMNWLDSLTGTTGSLAFANSPWIPAASETDFNELFASVDDIFGFDAHNNNNSANPFPTSLSPPLSRPGSVVAPFPALRYQYSEENANRVRAVEVVEALARYLVEEDSFTEAIQEAAVHRVSYSEFLSIMERYIGDFLYDSFNGMEIDDLDGLLRGEDLMAATSSSSTSSTAAAVANTTNNNSHNNANGNAGRSTGGKGGAQQKTRRGGDDGLRSGDLRGSPPLPTLSGSTASLSSATFPSLLTSSSSSSKSKAEKKEMRSAFDTLVSAAVSRVGEVGSPSVGSRSTSASGVNVLGHAPGKTGISTRSAAGSVSSGDNVSTPPPITITSTISTKLAPTSALVNSLLASSSSSSSSSVTSSHTTTTTTTTSTATGDGSSPAVITPNSATTLPPTGATSRTVTFPEGITIQDLLVPRPLGENDAPPDVAGIWERPDDVQAQMEMMRERREMEWVQRRMLSRMEKRFELEQPSRGEVVVRLSKKLLSSGVVRYTLDGVERPFSMAAPLGPSSQAPATTQTAWAVGPCVVFRNAYSDHERMNRCSWKVGENELHGLHIYEAKGKGGFGIESNIGDEWKIVHVVHQVCTRIYPGNEVSTGISSGSSNNSVTGDGAASDSQRLNAGVSSSGEEEDAL